MFAINVRSRATTGVISSTGISLLGEAVGPPFLQDTRDDAGGRHGSANPRLGPKIVVAGLDEPDGLFARSEKAPHRIRP